MLMLSPYEYREFVIYIGPERIAALLTVDEPAIGRIEAPVDHGEIQRIIEYDRAEMDAKVSTFYEGNLAVHFPDQRPLKWRDEKTAESRLVHVRSEERRVGKEWVSTCRSRWSPYHQKNKQYLCRHCTHYYMRQQRYQHV